MAPGFGRFALEDGDLVWARGVQRIPNPVRKGKDGKAIVLGPIAHQGWDLRRVKIIQALNDGALVEYGRTTFFARGLRSPNGIADGEYVTTWLAETSETHSYTAVLGARHTVRVLEYGQVVRGEEAAKAITASLAEWKSTPEIMRR